MMCSCRFFCNFARHKGIFYTQNDKTVWVASLALSLNGTA